jgi:hypothetical protein
MLQFTKKHIYFSGILAIACLLGISCSNDLLVTTNEPMPKLIQPGFLGANGEHLVVVDGLFGEKVCIYGLADLEAQVSFGRKGRGEGQFMVLPGETVLPYLLDEKLIISSHSKVSEFDWKGQLLSERTTLISTSNFQPLGDGYVALRTDVGERESFQILELYDADKQVVKEILRAETAFQTTIGNRLLTKRLQYQTYKDQLFVMGLSEDFDIGVYDSAGELVRTPNVSYERDFFTIVHEREVHEYFKENPNTREIYTIIAGQFIMPELMPATKAFLVADDRIYVWTFRVDRGLRELYVLKLNGVLEGIKQVPAGNQNLMKSGLSTVQGGRHYQLVTGSTGRDWSVAITELNQN